MRKTTLQILTENHLEKDVIRWKDDIIPPTWYWYVEEDNSIHADCGVVIPFIYNVRTQMARCRYDIIIKVIEHYKNMGVHLCSTDD